MKKETDMNIYKKMAYEPTDSIEDKAYMKTYHRKEFAKLAGISVDTVRRYQRSGILPDRRDPVNGYRIFTDEDLKALKLAKKPVVAIGGVVIKNIQYNG